MYIFACPCHSFDIWPTLSCLFVCFFTFVCIMYAFPTWKELYGVQRIYLIYLYILSPATPPPPLKPGPNRLPGIRKGVQTLLCLTFLNHYVLIKEPGPLVLSVWPQPCHFFWISCESLLTLHHKKKFHFKCGIVTQSTGGEGSMLQGK